jgi:hypothetical protein
MIISSYVRSGDEDMSPLTLAAIKLVQFGHRQAEMSHLFFRPNPPYACESKPLIWRNDPSLDTLAQPGLWSS